MDYEFKKNTLDGSYYCRCSMGHEILGRWVQEEIAKDKHTIQKVWNLLEKAKQAPTKDHFLLGADLMLLIQGDEVIVQENHFGQNDEIELHEEFSIYESESISVCGKEDFEALITAWQDFIS
ncbi:YacL family protein [Vibrio sp.]|nr:YacL family protein [Vibrio sp.]